MGKGMKAGKTKTPVLSNSFLMMEQAYRKGFEMGYIRGKTESEDEEMAGKAKYTDTDLIKGIEDGQDDVQIMDNLSIPEGSRFRILKRLANLRKTYGAREISIPQANGINYGKAKAAELIEKSRVDVETILTGIENKNKSLQGESVESLFQNESVASKMEKSSAVKQLEDLKGHCASMEEDTEDIWQDDVRALDVAIKALDGMDPAYSFDAPVNNFVERAELSFKADMDAYSSNVSKLREKMEHGQIIDLADVTEYNRIVDKYRA